MTSAQTPAQQPEPVETELEAAQRRLTETRAVVDELEAERASFNEKMAELVARASGPRSIEAMAELQARQDLLPRLIVMAEIECDRAQIALLYIQREEYKRQSAPAYAEFEQAQAEFFAAQRKFEQKQGNLYWLQDQPRILGADIGRLTNRVAQLQAELRQDLGPVVRARNLVRNTGL